MAVRGWNFIRFDEEGNVAALVGVCSVLLHTLVLRLALDDTKLLSWLVVVTDTVIFKYREQ